MFHPFGCEAWMHVPKAHRKKFDMKSKRTIFLGFQLQHQAYYLLDIETNQIITSRDVCFCITIFPKKEKPSAEEKNTFYISIHDDSDMDSDEDGSSSAGETMETQDSSLKSADEKSIGNPPSPSPSPPLLSSMHEIHPGHESIPHHMRMKTPNLWIFNMESIFSIIEGSDEGLKGCKDSFDPKRYHCWKQPIQ